MFLTLWATPRSTSTAFEWMMRQRGDFQCLHEPFNELFYYGEDRQSQRDSATSAKPGHNYVNVWAELLKQSRQSNLFLKDFAYSVEHFLDDEKLDQMTHSFLIRDPYKVIQGLHNHWPDCTFEETGFAALAKLFDRLSARSGNPVVVITSQDLLSDPEATTRAYCDAVGIEFIAEALNWEPGERSEVSWYGEGTGPWHESLRQSSGFKAQKSSYPALEENPKLIEMYQQCLPYYEKLLVHKLSIR